MTEKMNSFTKCELQAMKHRPTFEAIKASMAAEFVESIHFGQEGVYYYIRVENDDDYWTVKKELERIGYEQTYSGVRMADNGHCYTYYDPANFDSGFILVTLAYPYMEIHHVG